MWSFLTGREAAINYRFIDMAVEVPRDTGAEAPRATWKLNGTLQVTTRDNAAQAEPGRPEPWPAQISAQSTPTWSSPSTSPAPAPSPGTLTGSGTALELGVSDPVRLRRTLRRAARSAGIAEALARAGSRSRWSRPPARWSRWAWHAHLLAAAPGDRVAAHPHRAGRRAVVAGPRPGAGPGAAALPSRPTSRRRPTLFPLAPTFARRRPPVTTTHDPERRREPAADHGPAARTRGRATAQQVFGLRDDVTTIGSRRRAATSGWPDWSRCTPRSGTTTSDEFVLVRLGEPGGTRVNGAPSTARSCGPRRGCSSATGRCRSTVRSTPTTAARTAVASAASSATSEPAQPAAASAAEEQR